MESHVSKIIQKSASFFQDVSRNLVFNSHENCCKASKVASLKGFFYHFVRPSWIHSVVLLLNDGRIETIEFYSEVNRDKFAIKLKVSANRLWLVLGLGIVVFLVVIQKYMSLFL